MISCDWSSDVCSSDLYFIDISEDINQNKVGNIYEVLIEEQIEDNVYIGRTQYDHLVHLLLMLSQILNKLLSNDFVY